LNVLMFASNPFTNDPRVYNEARSLVQVGHKVTVIAWDREKRNPQRQSWDGIDVARVRTCLSVSWGMGSWPWHIFHLLSWQWLAYRKALTLNKVNAFNVIHCHDLDTLYIGIRLKRKLGLPLVYDAHEMYGYMASSVAPVWAGSMFSRLERWLVRETDRVITVSEAMRKYFTGITDKPISVAMNCKPLLNLEYQPPDRGKFTLVYIGLLDKTRTIPWLIKTVKELPRVNCVIGGIGKRDYVQVIKTECDGTSKVNFLGRVPLDDVLSTTKRADCIYLMIDPEHPYAQIALGNKQFEAMVCGRPIICTKDTYSGELTEKEKVGLAVEYTEDALKQAIIKLRDDSELRERLGRNALRAAITKYNWQSQEKKLLKLYRDIESELDEQCIT
jgi:glycosyltransferase involved in cell wall biosynthesis